MTVPTLDLLPSGVVPVVPEQRPAGAPRLSLVRRPAPAAARPVAPRRRLDPASVELRPSGTRSLTLQL